MKYFLKIKSGIYNPEDSGTTYNAVLDGIKTDDTLYSPWVEVNKDLWEKYNTMFTNGDYKTIPGAFIDLVDTPEFKGLHVSVFPEGEILF